MNLTSLITVDYENIANCKLCENKPNQTQFQIDDFLGIFHLAHRALYLNYLVEANAKGRWGGTAYNFFTRGGTYMRGWRTKFILLLIVYWAVGGKQTIKMFHDGEVFIRQAVKKVVESNL